MGRRTKYKDQFCEQARFLCEQFGATDEQLAKALGVSDATLYTWKKEHAQFLEAISRGKAEFDGREVDTSILNMARGFYYHEEFYDKLSGKIVRLWKFARPDVKAAALWKANRSGWRLPLGPGVRMGGQEDETRPELVGNAEPPGDGSDVIAGLDAAAQQRLDDLAVQILEAQHGTTIRRVVESQEVKKQDDATDG